RDGLSRAAFRAHYEEHHAPLGIAWFGFDRYVRNHVADDAPDAGFDCIAEFWPSDLDQIGRAIAAAGAVFEEDDARFMSPDRRGGTVEEWLLAGPVRAVDPPGTRKRIDLIPEATLPDLADLRRWAQAEVAAGRADRIAIDRPVATMGNLDGVALLYRWNCEEDAQPPGRRSVTRLVDVCETPPAELVAASRP
ncbi:MAG: EthD domain-containing protein, partial [Sphingomonadaceae bacterium]|nr:EthD domain-containing protein [Sphingomonadaceae bacterium]